MANLTRKTSLLILLNFFKYGVGFLVPMMLVRLLTKNDYGTYQQLLLVGSMAVGTMTLGFPSSIYYFYAHVDDDRHRRAFVLQIVLLFAVAGILTAIGVFLAKDFIATQMNNPALAEFLVYYCYYILFFLASEYFLSVLISKDLYTLAVKIESGEVIFRVALLLLPLLLGYGLHGLVISLAVYAFSRFAFYLIVLRRDIWPPPAGFSKMFFFREQLAYSLPLAMSSILSLFSRTIDRILISTNFSTAQLANYAVGAIEIPLDVIFQASVANVLRATLPGLAKDGNIIEIIRIWRTAVRKLAIIILPFFCFLSVFSYDFITFLFTDQYAESVMVFRIFLLLIPLHIFILSAIPQIFGKTKLTLQIIAASAVFNVATSIVLVKTVGYYGPPISTVLTNYFMSALFFMTTLRLLKCTIPQLLPLESLAKVLSSGFASALFVKIGFSFVESKFLTLSAGGILFFVVYGLLLLFLKEVTISEAQSTWRLLSATIVKRRTI